MKRWADYKDYLMIGEWHIHTTYVDGKNTIEDYCKKAEEIDLDLVAFTEHVRKELTYSFEDFISDVYSAKDRFDLIVLGGCEAKVLDLDGRLDATDNVLKNSEIVLGVFHSFPYNTKSDYLKALKSMINNPDVDIWAHPTLFAKRNGFRLEENEIREIVKHCKKNKVLIEQNKRYALPEKKFIDMVKEECWNLVRGSDAHSIDELSTMRKNNY